MPRTPLALQYHILLMLAALDADHTLFDERDSGQIRIQSYHNLTRLRKTLALSGFLVAVYLRWLHSRERNWLKAFEARVSQQIFDVTAAQIKVIVPLIAHYISTFFELYGG